VYGVAYDRLSSASGPLELRRIAAELLDAEHFQQLLIEASAELPWHIFEWLAAIDSVLEALPIPFEERLDPALARRARQAFKGVASVVLAVVRNPAYAAQLAERPEPGHLLDLVVDRRLPRAVRRALYERELAGVYVAAVFGAAFSQREPPDWMVRALYEGFTVGMGEWFDYAATALGAVIPDDLRTHVDWPRIFVEHQEARRAAELSRARFEQGGRRPMLVNPDDETVE
jgi:hypothetical protein